MLDTDDGRPELLPISLVAHHVFCPRRAWLEAMGEQTDTHQMEVGIQAHTASDDPTASRPSRVRAVEVASDQLGVTGRCDTVEWDDAGTATVVEHKSTPVRRQPSVTKPMVVQLTLQVEALRETGINVTGAAVYFTEHRTRIPVKIGPQQIQDARTHVSQTAKTLAANTAPQPLEDDPRCTRCSHAGVCLPDERAFTEVRRRVLVADPDTQVLHLTTPGARAAVRAGRIRVHQRDQELASVPLERVLVVRLSFDLVEGGAASLDFRDDFFGCCFPDEGLGIGVPVPGPDSDGFGEISNAGKPSPTQSLVGQLLEPPLHEIQPGTGGRREVQVPAPAILVRQPLGHLRRAVRGQVVQHHVHTQPARYRGVDLLEEPQHVGTLVGLAELREHLPGREIHRREQVDRPVALVVMGHRAGPPRLHRQRRLRTVQGLTLGLLVKTEHRNTSSTVPGGNQDLRPRPSAITPTPAVPLSAKRFRQRRTVSESTPATPGDLFVGHPVPGPQQRPRLDHLPVRQHRRDRHPRQLRPLHVSQHQRGGCDDRHDSTYRTISPTDH